MELEAGEACLVRLYNAAGCHQWNRLPDLAREFYSLGGTSLQLVSTTRFLVALVGYGPTLKATLTLHRAGLLPDHHPGKVDGPPGDAFELVYTTVTDTVRRKLHAADPVLAEWIRCHLYGDVYSSPGISLRMKQLLLCSYLALADMPDQLFGHALAAMRFGATHAQLVEAVQLAADTPYEFKDTNGSPLSTPHHNAKVGVLEEALRILAHARDKYAKDYADGPVACADVSVQLGTVRIPSLPPLYNTGVNKLSHVHKVEHLKEGAHPPIKAMEASPESTGSEGTAPPPFAWEELEAKRPKD